MNIHRQKKESQHSQEMFPSLNQEANSNYKYTPCKCESHDMSFTEWPIEEVQKIKDINILAAAIVRKATSDQKR
jgi:hypothetical protein